MNRPASAFDIKSASITGLALVLKTTDQGAIAAELATRVADAGDLFTHAPVLIDVSALSQAEGADDLALAPVVELLRQHTMRAVGIVGAEGRLLDQALALGLTEELDIRPRTGRKALAPAAAGDPVESARMPPGGQSLPLPAMGPADLFDSLAQDSNTPELRAAAAPHDRPEGQTAPDKAAPVPLAPTLVVDKPLRSGQRVYARGGDLVVLGVVSHGAEVIADGNIHVYGPLRGRAIAGASGDADARIFAAAMEPELISIAGTYRTTDRPLAPEVLGKPAQARLDGDKMLIEPLKN